jgi:long-chain acyl-CoA synthetase
VITLDAEELPTWAEAHQKPSRPPEELAAELAGDPELLAEIETAVEDANQAVSRAESIREFRVLEGDFSVAGGELTPTLKVKRNVVLERCAATIDDIYGTG